MATTRARIVLLPTVVVALSLLAVAGCSSQTSPAATGTASASTGATTALAGTSWTLDSYSGPNGATVAAATIGNVATLAYGADGTYSGSTGCNRMAGTYTQDGASLTMQPGPMTLMACQEPVATQEAELLAALPEVASFTADTSLVLLSADGATLLTYRPAMTSLAGTSWRATGINNGAGGVVNQAGTEKVTAEFGADGQLSGSGGCNSYSATYETTESDRLVLGPITSTEMACPDATMKIEQEYFAALATVATYQIDGSSLTLRDDSGATQATYTLVP